MARYPFPWDLFLGLARDLPVGSRSLAADCIEMRARMSPPPVVAGLENVPRSGPVVIAANHYQRRGLWIGWPGAVITAVVADCRGPEFPLRWLTTGGLRWMQWKGRGPEVPLTHALLRRVADAYGMTALPLDGTFDRAVALRDWIRHAQAGEAAGIFPEGPTGRGDGLRRPELGFDALCRLLCTRGIPILPCGICEEGETLHVRFGEIVQCRDMDGDGVMRAIARLVPPDLRGVYSAVPAGAR